jgi:uncharacterized protein (DUF1778 family)
MSARQPKGTDAKRVHILVPLRPQLKQIDAAARKLNLSRSHYIVTAAHAAAQADLAKDKAKS